MSVSAPPVENGAAPRHGPQGPLAALAVAAGWSVYLPLGLQYLAFLALGTAALFALGRSATGGRQILRHPLFWAITAFWAWLALSSAWTSAPGADVVAHLWSYSLAFWILPIAHACAAPVAARALRHFVIASTLAGAAMLVDHSGGLALLPAAPTLTGITGNQRIAYSLLLAVASAIAALLALDAPAPRQRLAWGACALVCAAGLATQDRRSGMLVLPLLLVVLAWLRTPTWPRRALLAAAIASALALAPLAGVQQRFAEGLSELRAYRSEGDVATSWGMRARMFEVTAAMVAERPLAGFGVGSWATEWRRRVHGGLLQGHTTPHNEYLLIAAQSGAIGLALAALAGLLSLRAIRRCGPAAHAALLVLLTLAAAAAFNAVLRDTKFALPLLTLAALSWAAARVPAARSCPGSTAAEPGHAGPGLQEPTR